MSNRNDAPVSRALNTASSEASARSFSVSTAVLTGASVAFFGLALSICDAAPTTALILGLLGMLVLSAAHAPEQGEEEPNAADRAARALRSATLAMGENVSALVRSWRSRVGA